MESFKTKMITNTMTIRDKMKMFTSDASVDCDKVIQEWLEIPSLVNEKYLNERLFYTGYSKRQFAFSLLPSNNIERITKIWFDTLEVIIENFIDDDEKDIYEKGIVTAVYPFIKYTKSEIVNLLTNIFDIQYDEIVMNKLLQDLSNELTGIISKVLIVELNIFKTTHTFNSSDPVKMLTEFLSIYFNNKESYKSFFLKYPTCIQTITIRTEFFLKNFSLFISNLIKSKDEILNILNQKKLTLTDIELSAGDSHERGKKVFIVEVNNEKIVYKPKNLEISESLRTFLKWIDSNSETSNLLDIKLPWSICKDTYTFQEYINREDTANLTNIKRFYERFGYWVAISYIFQFNDLHFENLIAQDEYPVIIDMETLFCNTSNFSSSGSSFEKINFSVNIDSVLGSALLPNSIDLLIPEDDGNVSESVEMSGLASNGYKFKQKVLQPDNMENINFKYTSKNYTMPKNRNVPVVDGKDISYKAYCREIILGFKKMMNFIIENKNSIINDQDLIGLFRKKKIRYLVKDTQKYATLLQYSIHPNYCSKMINKEKLIENVWAFPHPDKRIVQSEYEDLLCNDVPIFFSYTDSKDLYDSKGEKIKNYFNKSSFEQVINKISLLTMDDIDRQVGILRVSLNSDENHFQNNNVACGNKENLFDSERMTNLLLDEIVVGDNGNVNWETLTCFKNNEFKIESLNIDLYDGLSGVAVHFLELFKETKNIKYFSLYEKVIGSALEISELYPKSISVYQGKLSVIYPILLEVSILGESSRTHYVLDYLQEISTDMIKESFNFEWLNGLAGFLQLLTTTYQKYPDEYLLHLMNVIIEVFLERENDILNITDHGFAHGSCGIALSLSSCLEVISNYQIEDLVIKLLKNEFNQMNKSLLTKSSGWCRGTTGMILARVYINKKLDSCIIRDEIKTLSKWITDENYELESGDNLCHGNLSNIVCLKEVSRLESIDVVDRTLLKIITQFRNEKILKGSYSILNVDGISNKGVFNGVFGISLSYLYLNSHENSSILTLTI